ncbi:MAG: dTDP-4-dehydrorhamnose 3,5-epimerase [Bacteroidetes bacterium]|nr:dTDP-4-dehydrorhamnose 3,5-epimerase [Bacteroidota bacterium]MCH8523886.1 dTDP-4-dehydrorhamnose 3,5-epimerase [Balneolales bacterium]
MNIIKTDIADILVAEPRIFTDDRGYFMETYRYEWLTDFGITHQFVQDNLSRSKKGVLRGLHYQIRNAQAKLVMVTQGEVLDIAVDIRKGSPSFGKYVSMKLSADNRRIMYIPEGFAHGFLVLSEQADFLYKCSRYYDPSGERGLRWSDPTINIQWEVSTPILSEKDGVLPLLNDIKPEDLPEYHEQ